MDSTISGARDTHLHKIFLCSLIDLSPELNAVNELPAIALTEKARRLAGDLEYPEDGKPQGPPKPLYMP